MPVLNDQLSAQLSQLLTKVVAPIELAASLDNSDLSAQVRELLEEIAAKSENITLTDEANPRTPSFAIRRIGTDVEVRFAGLPLGHEFSSLVLALLQVGGHPAKISDEQRQAIQRIKGPREFVTYMSLTCQNCPEVVQALNTISIINPSIRHTAVEGGAFQSEVENHGIMSVPVTFEGDEMFSSGRTTLDDFVSMLDEGGAQAAVDQMNQEEPYDVVIVGGGPAASSAAIYTARKGIRTAMVMDHRGGQVVETESIENAISQVHTTGSQLAADLTEHINQYDIDMYVPQWADRLEIAAVSADDNSRDYPLHTVVTRSGGHLRARSVIVASGATWRTLGVPGEEEYRNKGVSFCPHCDGPLFKNKDVVVVGGGNSGIEAAIDLAGVARHVTVVEFLDQLKADRVLLDAMDALDNVDVIVGARSTEVIGDGQKVTALAYEDRASGETRSVDTDGIFIQIGLVPNTQWLPEEVELSDRREVVTDREGKTNVLGIFAAGDCTDEPYKQIVTAFGSGATAALSAFNYLIRAPHHD
ncbi:MAG: alkyl hydroperoxide reductase subunit F [Actinomyces sp.]|nr:alkyl hydroperoxide reductase subunit F [Actinomyces sp.]